MQDLESLHKKLDALQVNIEEIVAILNTKKDAKEKAHYNRVLKTKESTGKKFPNLLTMGQSYTAKELHNIYTKDNTLDPTTVPLTIVKILRDLKYIGESYTKRVKNTAHVIRVSDTLDNVDSPPISNRF